MFNAMEVPGCPPLSPVLPSTLSMFNAFEAFCHSPGCPSLLACVQHICPSFRVPGCPPSFPSSHPPCLCLMHSRSCFPLLSPTITHLYLTSAQFLQTCKLTS